MKQVKSVYENPYSSDNSMVNDWTKALSIPYEELDSQKMNDLRVAASSWKICACGNLCYLLPREQDGEPIDSELFDLGVDFEIQVDEMNFVFKYGSKSDFEIERNKAIETHSKIEKRATEILTEMGLLKPSKLFTST